MSLSTHVLDTERGRPAAGVRVELYDEDGTLVADAVTDNDGRIRELADTTPGTYRIVFHPASPFFKRIVSASGVVGPLAPSRIMRALMRGAFSVVS